MGKTFTLFLFITYGILCQAQSKWELVDAKDVPVSEAAITLQSLFADKSFTLGSDAVPSPRIGAAMWQDSKSNVWMLGGLGYDESGNYGVLNDLWLYDISSMSWTLKDGLRQIVPQLEKLDELTRPAPRRDAITWTDPLGNLWLMGGKPASDSEHYHDLWQYQTGLNVWVRISAPTKENLAGVFGKKNEPATGNTPGSRSGASSWTDAQGTLWMFGGLSQDYGRGQEDYNNDLWSYSILTKTWKWVSGSEKPNTKNQVVIPGADSEGLGPGARTKACSWYNKERNQLWLYGGYGVDSTGNSAGGLSDLWAFDIKTEKWQLIDSGDRSGKADQARRYQASPGFRWSAITWTDSEGNLLLLGGQNTISNTTADIDPVIWKYNLKKQVWGPLFVAGSPDITGEGRGFTDQAGNIYLFSGKKFNPSSRYSYPSNQIWKLQLK